LYNNINIDIFGIIATKVVTIVGIASYTSGLQKWNGAAEILNNNPIDIIANAICTYKYCVYIYKYKYTIFILSIYISAL
jgi:hypothetical protein